MPQQTDTPQTDTPLKEMIANPTKHFAGPQQVLAQPGLTRENKLAILEAMELDARELSVATAENMPGPGGDADRLAAISEAIRSLEEPDGQNPG